MQVRPWLTAVTHGHYKGMGNRNFENRLRGSTALMLMLIVPFLYSVLFSLTRWLYPAEATAWVLLLDPVADVVGSWLPIVGRWSNSLTVNGYITGAQLVEHVLPMQWLCTSPFFVYLILFCTPYGAAGLKKGLTKEKVIDHLGMLLLLQAFLFFFSFIGFPLEFGSNHGRFRLAAGSIDAWMPFYFGLTWVFLFCVVGVVSSSIVLITRRWSDGECSVK